MVDAAGGEMKVSRVLRGEQTYLLRCRIRCTPATNLLSDAENLKNTNARWAQRCTRATVGGRGQSTPRGRPATGRGGGDQGSSLEAPACRRRVSPNATSC